MADLLSSAEICRTYRRSKDEQEKKVLFAILPYALRLEALQRELSGWPVEGVNA